MSKTCQLCYNCKYYESSINTCNTNSPPENEHIENKSSFNNTQNTNSPSDNFTWDPFNLKKNNSKFLEIFKPLKNTSSELFSLNDLKYRIDSTAHQFGTKFWELTKFIGGKVGNNLDNSFENASDEFLNLFRKAPIPDDIILCNQCNCLTNIELDCLSNNYLIIQHGILDSPISMLDISFILLRDNPHLNIYIPYCTYGNTLLGIDSTSCILALELIRFFDSIHFKPHLSAEKAGLNDINCSTMFDSINISTIGHSFGSLTILTALNKLEEEMSLISSGRIKLVNFIGVASPFFGIYENFTLMKSSFDILNTNMLNDLDYKTDALLNLYSCTASDLLFTFDRIILYGNAKNDTLVGPRTSISIPINTFTDHQLKTLIKKCIKLPGKFIYVPGNYKYNKEMCNKIAPIPLTRPMFQTGYDKLMKTASSDEFYEIRGCNENYKLLVEEHKTLLIEYLENLRLITETKYRHLFDSSKCVNSHSVRNSYLEIELFEAIEEITGIDVNAFSIKPLPIYQLLIAFFELATSIDLTPSLEEFKFDDVKQLHFHVIMTLFNIKDLCKKVERYMVFIPTITPHRHIIGKNCLMVLSDSYKLLAEHMNSIKCFTE